AVFNGCRRCARRLAFDLLGTRAARATPATLATFSTSAAAAFTATTPTATRAALAAPAAGAGAATAAPGLVRRALLARLAEDLAHALALGRLGFHAFARLARQRGQQLGGHRLGGDLLFDEGLDVRQAHRVALAGEA